MATEAQRRAVRKYDKEHITYFKLTMRNEFAAQFEKFMQSEEGKRFSSKSKFIIEAMKEKMKAEGYHFDD